MVTAGFDLVAVGIEDEGTVVVLVVVRTWAGRAVVLAAGLARRGVEGVDLGVALRRKADMRAVLGVAARVERLGHADPEAGMRAADLAIAVGDDALARHVDREDAGAADGLQHVVVEALGAIEIGDTDREVIDHRIPPKPPPPMPPPPIPP